MRMLNTILDIFMQVIIDAATITAYMFIPVMIGSIIYAAIKRTKTEIIGNTIAVFILMLAGCWIYETYMALI